MLVIRILVPLIWWVELKTERKGGEERTHSQSIWDVLTYQYEFLFVFALLKFINMFGAPLVDDASNGWLFVAVAPAAESSQWWTVAWWSKHVKISQWRRSAGKRARSESDHWFHSNGAMLKFFTFLPKNQFYWLDIYKSGCGVKRISPTHGCVATLGFKLVIGCLFLQVMSAFPKTRVIMDCGLAANNYPFIWIVPIITYTAQ